MIPDRLNITHMGEGLDSLALLGEKKLPARELSSVSVVRITDGAKIHLASCIPAKKLYVTADSLAAKSVYEKLSAYPDARVVYVPHRDDVLVHRKSFSLRCSRQRRRCCFSRSSG